MQQRFAFTLDVVVIAGWFVELRNCFDLQYWIERGGLSSLKSLGSFSSDPPSQLDILWHDGHTFGVNGAQVGVLEKSD